MTELGLLKKVLHHSIGVLLEPKLGCSELRFPILDESPIFLDGKDSLVCVVEESLSKCVFGSDDLLFLLNKFRDGLLVLGWCCLAVALEVCLLNLSLEGETTHLAHCAGLVLVIELGLGWGAPERGLSLLSSIFIEVL